MRREATNWRQSGIILLDYGKRDVSALVFKICLVPHLLLKLPFILNYFLFRIIESISLIVLFFYNEIKNNALNYSMICVNVFKSEIFAILA